MIIGYGYRLFRKALSEEERQDCHIGAYGFSQEDEAINDAKRRLKGIEMDEAFCWSIETYSYALDEGVDLENVKPITTKTMGRVIRLFEKGCLNET